MRIDPRDVNEALIQAPGDQLVALSATITRFREAVVGGAFAGELLFELDSRLKFFSERATAIVPIVEKLHERAEHALFVESRPYNTDERQGTTPFTTAVRPAYARELLRQLADARELGDVGEASKVREAAISYCLEDLDPPVRKALLAGLRTDASAYGDTPNGCGGDLQATVRERFGADAL